jgi:succinate dehydrogenase / fumarate reductase membrane anchor subunit
MMVSSVALLLLIPMFVFTFGSILGSSYEEVIAYYQRPFPAVVAALTMLVGFFHFRGGVQTLIEDYVHGFARKVAIIGMICLSYGAAAFAIFAIVRIAL